LDIFEELRKLILFFSNRWSSVLSTESWSLRNV